MITPNDILKEYWGYSHFRSLQQEIVQSVLNGNDVIALLPTGGGKSICFQVPGLMLEGVCVVISPLRALMHDQVAALQQKGIKAVALTSGISQNEIITIFDNIQYGGIQFLYLSPERLQSVFIQEKIKQLQVALFAIDEAHCISEWGHDFRPSYVQLKVLRELHPNIPIIALTATATSKVIADIAKYLNLENHELYKKSFLREKLAYQVFNVEDKLYKLQQILNRVEGPAIVYVNSRRKTKEISDFLNAQGFLAAYYHGGMSAEVKQTNFDLWMHDVKRIMVATSAFGMGIDKPNVRLVIHLHLPSSIENYMQEAGRAGRDENKAYAVMLKNNADVKNFKLQMQQAIPTVDFVKKIYFSLNQYFHIAYGEVVNTPFSFEFQPFCEKYQFPVLLTYNSIKLLDSYGVLEFQEQLKKKSTLQFCVESAAVFQYKADTTLENFIKTILRSYGGLFEQPTTINEYVLSRKCNLPVQTIIGYLQKLHSDELVTYQAANNQNQIVFLDCREDNRTINRIARQIKSFQNHKYDKAIKLLQFIQQNTTCRSNALLTYFEEETQQECGICDICARKKKMSSSDLKSISSLILHLFDNENALSSREITANIKANEQEVLKLLQLLLEKNKLKMNEDHKFELAQPK